MITGFADFLLYMCFYFGFKKKLKTYVTFIQLLYNRNRTTLTKEGCMFMGKYLNPNGMNFKISTQANIFVVQSILYNL